MITSALEVGEEARRRKHHKVSYKHFISLIVNTVDVAVTRDAPPSKGSKKITPSDYRCFNCSATGHYVNQCPKPKAKYTSCGRTGHSAQSCTRLRHNGPLGRTRAGLLRMTQNGIHLNLVDEATKSSLFEAMRAHLESQEQSYEKAKAKAKIKRDEKRVEVLLECLGTAIPMETEAAINKNQLSSYASSGQEIAHATYLHQNLKTPSYYIDIEVFGQRFPSLLDSGAVVSLIHTDVGKSFSENKETVATCEPSILLLTGLGGTFRNGDLAFSS